MPRKAKKTTKKTVCNELPVWAEELRSEYNTLAVRFNTFQRRLDAIERQVSELANTSAIGYQTITEELTKFQAEMTNRFSLVSKSSECCAQPSCDANGEDTH